MKPVGKTMSQINENKSKPLISCMHHCAVHTVNSVQTSLLSRLTSPSNHQIIDFRHGAVSFRPIGQTEAPWKLVQLETSLEPRRRTAPLAAASSYSLACRCGDFFFFFLAETWKTQSFRVDLLGSSTGHQIDPKSTFGKTRIAMRNQKSMNIPTYIYIGKTSWWKSFLF